MFLAAQAEQSDDPAVIGKWRRTSSYSRANYYQRIVFERKCRRIKTEVPGCAAGLTTTG